MLRTGKCWREFSLSIFTNTKKASPIDIGIPLESFCWVRSDVKGVDWWLTWGCDGNKLKKIFPFENPLRSRDFPIFHRLDVTSLAHMPGKNKNHKSLFVITIKVKWPFTTVLWYLKILRHFDLSSWTHRLTTVKAWALRSSSQLNYVGNVHDRDRHARFHKRSAINYYVDIAEHAMRLPN